MSTQEHGCHVQHLAEHTYNFNLCWGSQCIHAPTCMRASVPPSGHWMWWCDVVVATLPNDVQLTKGSTP